ncbi:hypothetical protein [Cesiribacter sp. SM1]|uniref:hypothetical protein n=1 Tax=Cesiribacter sp. SM1 TaxID=2861196 RepID=UPI001CD31CC9|nr:hypothetical protein [Cesiribacter sp. SM1]
MVKKKAVLLAVTVVAILAEKLENKNDYRLYVYYDFAGRQEWQILLQTGGGSAGVVGIPAFIGSIL